MLVIKTLYRINIVCLKCLIIFCNITFNTSYKSIKFQNTYVLKSDKYNNCRNKLIGHFCVNFITEIFGYIPVLKLQKRKIFIEFELLNFRMKNSKGYFYFIFKVRK